MDVSDLHVTAREVLRKKRYHDKLRQVRWLEGEEAEIKPAPRSLYNIPHYENEAQESNCNKISSDNDLSAPDEAHIRNANGYEHKLAWRKRRRTVEGMYGQHAKERECDPKSK